LGEKTTLLIYAEKKIKETKDIADDLGIEEELVKEVVRNMGKRQQGRIKKLLDNFSIKKLKEKLTWKVSLITLIAIAFLFIASTVPKNDAGLLIRSSKEVVKTAIVEQSEKIGDRDCIAVASMFEDDIKLASRYTPRFVRAFVTEGGALCKDVIPGYLPVVNFDEQFHTPYDDLQIVGNTYGNEFNSIAPQTNHVVTDQENSGHNTNYPTNQQAEANQQEYHSQSIDNQLQYNSQSENNESKDDGAPTEEIIELNEVIQYDLSYFSQPLTAEVASAFQSVNSYLNAQWFLREHFDARYLIAEIKENPDAQMQYIYLSLPDQLSGNRFIDVVLGNRLFTRAGEVLPRGVVAIIPHFPEDTIGMIGPHVWTAHPGSSPVLYGNSLESMYGAAGYPNELFVEIYLQYPSPKFPYPPTDRVGNFVGLELLNDEIAHGTIYLCTDNLGKWRLNEYPNIPESGDCARLLWNFNPLIPGAGEMRNFDPSPGTLVEQQNKQLNISIEKLTDGESMQNNVGPSIVFRTDIVTGESDFIVFPAYLYLSNPRLLRDMLIRTPFPSGDTPRPHQLLAASPDLHYAFANGFGPTIFNEHGLPVDMSSNIEDSTTITHDELLKSNNATSFVIGR
jgi:hypothetical protein